MKEAVEQFLVGGLSQVKSSEPVKTRAKRLQFGASLAEFGPVLFVFLLVVLFPLINLMAFAAGAATVGFLTTQAAGAASQAPTFQSALSDMESTVNRIASSGFGQFAKLKPVAGYQGTGTDLYVVVTDTASGTPYYFGPNGGFSNWVDESVAIFEMECRSQFDVGPFLNMSGMPFIGDVPIVGKAARLSWNCSRAVEHLEALGPVVKGNGDPNSPPPAPPGAREEPPNDPSDPGNQNGGGGKYPPWTNGNTNPK